MKKPLFEPLSLVTQKNAFLTQFRVSDVKDRDLSQVAKNYEQTKERASENEPSLIVEGCAFESKERVMEAIHDLATRLQFELKKQARKRDRTGVGEGRPLPKRFRFRNTE